ncbi:hypothetical protein [Acidovorax sp. CCYZU-2555]|uniref:hypothetical protein n=1 Tax=Acidovorax sp. CCYZU-2555 TaxID=2835042 RepID=UPI0020C035B6|nr:hypothetical protein [Acidovorax sp. CCYZU-2555]
MSRRLAQPARDLAPGGRDGFSIAVAAQAGHDDEAIVELGLVLPIQTGLPALRPLVRHEWRRDVRTRALASREVVGRGRAYAAIQRRVDMAQIDAGDRGVGPLSHRPFALEEVVGLPRLARVLHVLCTAANQRSVRNAVRKRAAVVQFRIGVPGPALKAQRVAEAVGRQESSRPLVTIEAIPAFLDHADVAAKGFVVAVGVGVAMDALALHIRQQGQLGVAAQAQRQRRREIALVLVGLGRRQIVVFGLRDQAIEHRAFLVQRAGHIGGYAMSIAIPGAQTDRALRILGRSLGDRVDHAAGRVAAHQQRSRAAQKFDTFHAVAVHPGHGIGAAHFLEPVAVVGSVGRADTAPSGLRRRITKRWQAQGQCGAAVSGPSLP